jgi:hypothetical protein
MPYSAETKPYAHGYLRDLIFAYVGSRPHTTYLSEHQDTIVAVVVIEASDFPQGGYGLSAAKEDEIPRNHEGFREL